jgi:DUF1365 family protein
MTGASGLYLGRVMHHRRRPRVHRLRYRMFSLLLDLDEIDDLVARLRLFSRGRFNLFAFHDADHGDGSATSLRTQIEAHLAAAGIEPDGGAIRLLTMPRICGHVFNPVSVYFCHGRDGDLRAIVYEVNNTFGQRHSYLLPAAVDAGGIVRHSSPKSFRVSPFMALDMTYDFRVLPPGERLAIAITGRDSDGVLITAALSADRRPLSDATLLRAAVAQPLMTLKVVAGIGWEALLLWAKGVPVHRLPPAPARSVTAPARP